ncbi:ATP-binding protein [Marinovum sp.]|uniref:ATP-binding protein n=1 Tax=Marinovum sp. TaxID=2024839 RepID=UPI002B2772AA|nr:ATP-binding protein [Marinovum sp.]
MPPVGPDPPSDGPVLPLDAPALPLDAPSAPLKASYAPPKASAQPVKARGAPAHAPAPPQDGPVSRRRYLRERRAREEAEGLLDNKSRELFDANAALKRQAATLEDQVRERTAELTRATAEAERANAAKTAFLAMISHEIRTPLNGVLGMAEALSDTGLELAQQDMLDVMTASGQALLSIVNDILDLSKIEAEQMEIEEVGFNLHELLEGVCRLYALKAEEKGLSFERRFDFDAACRVMSDPTRMRQVISNLVSNAVKFTLRGSIRLEARLRVPDKTGRARLEVRISDTGPGVPADKRDRLFKPFSQTDASITRRHGGTGLGLWIARRICALMAGDLVFHAPSEGGAVFVASFHVGAGVLPEGTTALGPREAERLLCAQPWKVLVAEDNKTNRLVLHHLLKRYPLAMTMVENGAEAVAAFSAARFDLVLMDVNMPVMGGLEAVSRLRAHEQAAGRAACPVIALTANAMTHQVEEYLRRGIDAHVAKPVKREVLVQRMADVLTARRPDAGGRGLRPGARPRPG